MSELKTAEDHVALISETLTSEIKKKYMAGQEEHGGKLWRKPVLGFAWEEVLDLPVYLHVLKQQHDEMKAIALAGAQGENSQAACAEIYNILTIGNAEGAREEGD